MKAFLIGIAGLTSTLVIFILLVRICRKNLMAGDLDGY